MTDQPTCPRCGKPIHDMGYVCRSCATKATDALTVVATLAGEETTTIARLDQVNRTGGLLEPLEPWPKADSALYPTALPVNLDAAQRFHEAAGTLGGLAARIAAERGQTVAISGPCHHDTCRRITDRHGPLIAGPVCPDHGKHELAYVAGFLAEQVDWIRHRPDADRLLRSIVDNCAQLVAVVDRPADRWYAGTCDECGEALWPAAGVSTIRCDCGAEYDADERRTTMVEQLEEVWLGPDHCAHALSMLSIPTNASTIRTWAERGRLAPHPDSLPGRPRYRVGSVRELVVQMHAEQRERTLRAAVRNAELAARKAAQAKEPMSA